MGRGWALLLRLLLKHFIRFAVILDEVYVNKDLPKMAFTGNAMAYFLSFPVYNILKEKEKS